MKRKGQKYQNREEYTLKYQPLLAKLKEDTPKDLLCARCFEQVDWKLKFGKYKKMTQAKRCRECDQKAVVKSYRHICDPCSRSKRLCTKCGLSKDLRKELPKCMEEMVEYKKLEEIKAYLKTLKESSRRKLMRFMNEETVDFIDGKFFYKENKQEVEGIRLKRKFMECSEDNDNSEDDENSKEFEDGELNELDNFVFKGRHVDAPELAEDSDSDPEL